VEQFIRDYLIFRNEKNRATTTHDKKSMLKYRALKVAGITKCLPKHSPIRIALINKYLDGDFKYESQLVKYYLATSYTIKSATEMGRRHLIHYDEFYKNYVT